MKDALTQYINEQLQMINTAIKSDLFSDIDRELFIGRMVAGICEDCGRVTDKCHCMNDE